MKLLDGYSLNWFWLNRKGHVGANSFFVGHLNIRGKYIWLLKSNFQKFKNLRVTVIIKPTKIVFTN